MVFESIKSINVGCRDEMDYRAEFLIYSCIYGDMRENCSGAFEIVKDELCINISFYKLKISQFSKKTSGMGKNILKFMKIQKGDV